MANASAPPGPPGSFLSGNLGDFSRARLEFLTRCAREYGDIVALRFGPRRVWLLSHPDLIEAVLVTHARHFTKHFALRLTPLVLGNGLLTSEGDFWLRQRRLMQPVFLRKHVAPFGPIMVDYTRRLLAGWQPGATRDIVPEMMRLTRQIAVKSLFDIELAQDPGDLDAILQTLQEDFNTRFNRTVPLPLWLPTPANGRLKRAVARLDEFLYGLIRQRRATVNGGEDLLSRLLRARDEEDQSGMTDQQLRDEVTTLFLAGHETTGLVLSWTWYLLATHPEAEARLTTEVAEVLNGRPANVEDVPRLCYTEQVVHEAMRLYPPAYVFGREAAAECDVGGRRVPRGMTILMSPWVVHRDPRFFERPEEFRPERWAGDAVHNLPKYAYFPFGGGPRQCIGNAFAMLQLVLVLATIAQQFRFKLVPGHAVVPWATFTLRPQHGILAPLTRR